MAHDSDVSMCSDRRTFLQAGAVAAASACVTQASQAQDAKPADANPVPVVPRRVLGKSGVEITMVEQGAIRGANLDLILRHAFASGIRTFDTAKVYGSEPNFKKWFDQAPEVRKQIFLVTKDNPKTPSQMLKQIDQRLATLGTDYIDLFFVHGLGDEHSVEKAIDFVKSREFKETAESLRKSGKAKLVGFSCHHRQRGKILQAAAEAGVVDAIMVQYRPWLDKESALNKALDACHAKGIGLISMKQVAGQFFLEPGQKSALEEVKTRMPMLEEKKLTVFQGLLHAIWSDERISSICVSMRNIDQIRENTEAARRFEPLKEAEIHQLRDASIAFGSTLCADCDGRCSTAAGTTAELGDLTRFLTYHQHLGDRTEARRQYAALSPEARDWSGADLEAARAACPNKLDFARLLPEVDRHLA